jgi:biotin carboxyl carrier protein
MASVVRTVQARAGDRTFVVRVLDDSAVSVEGIEGTFTVARVDRHAYRVTRAEGAERGEASRLVWARVDGPGGVVWATANGDTIEVALETSARPARPTVAAVGSLAAPMPATVVSVRVKPGDAVTRGQTLALLEAMKMELPLRAPADGVVRAVHCQPGELVQPGPPLIELD